MSTCAFCPLAWYAETNTLQDRECSPLIQKGHTCKVFLGQVSSLPSSCCCFSLCLRLWFCWLQCNQLDQNLSVCSIMNYSRAIAEYTCTWSCWSSDEERTRATMWNLWSVDCVPKMMNGNPSLDISHLRVLSSVSRLCTRFSLRLLFKNYQEQHDESSPKQLA